MTKAELVAKVADKAGLKQKDAAVAVSATFDAIAEALKKDDKVALVGFGTFSVKKRASREGVNPATGKKIKIAASKVPGFKAGKALKDLVK